MKFQNNSLFHLLCVLLCLCFKCANGNSGRYADMIMVPQISCPQYLEYKFDGIHMQGILKLPSNAYRTYVSTEWSTKQTGQLGQFLISYDPVKLSSNVIEGKPIEIEIQFPNLNSIPKLVRIDMDNQTICTGPTFPVPSYTFFLNTTVGTGRPVLSDRKNCAKTKASATNENSLPAPSNNAKEFAASSMTAKEFAALIFNSHPTTTKSPIQFVARTQPTETPQNMGEICGLRAMSFSTFINFGQEFQPLQIPWLVALYRKVPGGVYFMCGGTLVSARTVITAAHCLQSHVTENDVVVHIGKHNLEDYREKFEMRQADKLIIHPDFNATSPPDADIGILQFTEPIRIDSVIIPICLWSGDESIAEIVGQKGYVAGWGADEHGNNVTSIPKVVSANIASESDCLRDTGLHRHLISPRTLCAGNLDATGPCTGDSGGGLMIQRNGRWHLRGILSGGARIDGKCNLKSHVLYCDIAKHMNWIRNNVMY